MKRKHRILSSLLALCLVIGMLPVTALAADGASATTWDELKAAIEGATAPISVTIDGTVEKDADDTAITIPAGISVTVTGTQGARILRPDTSTVGEFVVSTGAELTLSGNLTIAGASNGTTPGDLACANFIRVEAGGTLHLAGAVTAETSGTYYQNHLSSFIFCEGEATIEPGAALSGWKNMNSTGNFDAECAALVVKGPTARLTMTGGEVFGNANQATSSRASSAAIQIRDGATFRMEGGLIHDNTAGKQGCGGGVMIAGSGCRFEMTGGSIRGNSARYGAGVYAAAEDSLAPVSVTMTGGEISQNILSNISSSYGGGLYAENAIVQISKPAGAGTAPSFAGNITSGFPGSLYSPFTSSGGAIYCLNTTLSMDGAVITGTRADSTNYKGGTIYLGDTNAELKNCSVTDNQCGVDNMAFGGAFYIEGASAVTMDHMTITNNSATPDSKYTNGGAGAILISGDQDTTPTLTITNSQISGNLTGGSCAGAIYAECADLSIFDTEITGNTVKKPESEKAQSWFNYSGGALYLSGSTVRLERVLLSDNQCVDGYGGAIRMTDITSRDGAVLVPCSVTLTDCILTGNKAEHVNPEIPGGMGGAIYITSGTLDLAGTTQISQNLAATGGAIVNEGICMLQGGTITANHAVGNDAENDAGVAGGVANLGTFTMTGGELHSNRAETGGNDFYNYAKSDLDIGIDDNWDGNHDMELDSLSLVSRAAPDHGTFTLLPADRFGFDAWYEDAPDARYQNGDPNNTPYPVTENDTSKKYLTTGSPLAKKVTVTFLPGEHGTLEDGKKEFVLTEGDQLKEVPVPSPHSDWQFVNWVEKEDGLAYTTEDILDMKIQRDMVFTAQYQPSPSGGDDPTYTLHYESNGGTPYLDEQYVQDALVALDKLPVREGYRFTGWYADQTLTQQITEIKMTSHKTVYAGWELKDTPVFPTYYTLRYESNGGTPYRTEQYLPNTLVVLDKLPVREGYRFTGWYADPALTQRITEIKMTSHKTVYAGWEDDGVPNGLNGRDHIAYVSGYPDGTVRPDAPVTRAETAAMLFRLLTDERRAEIATEGSRFSDVQPASWYAQAVSAMANGGYITGYSDGTFGPDRPITRAEFVAMLARFIGLEAADCSFTDVPRTHWAYGYIATATAAGWIDGYNDGAFGPDRKITRAEAMTILNRVLNRGVNETSTLLNFRAWPDNPKNAWYYYEVIEATNDHEYTGSRPAEDWTSLVIR